MNAEQITSALLRIAIAAIVVVTALLAYETGRIAGKYEGYLGCVDDQLFPTVSELNKVKRYFNE